MGDPDETYTDEETKRRREAALKRMLNTPHKPHDTLKRGTNGRNRTKAQKSG